MHAGNLGHGILETRCVRVGDIAGELIFSLLEEFILADHLLLQPGNLLLQLSRLLVSAGNIFLQVIHLSTEVSVPGI